MKVCVVAGARPNFIKLAPLIRAIHSAKKQGNDIDVQLVYTGSDDDITVEPSLFSDLGIHQPDFYLNVTCSNLNELTGQVMSKFEDYLQHRPADVVVVVDDLASTMAVAIVTKKQGVTLAHIAAGTRSFDINMPKEINRLVIDGLSDILFTAGMSNNSIANREGAELSKVYMVGNILIDNLRYLRNRIKRPALMNQMKLSDDGYIVFTLNRKALLAQKDNLHLMLEAIVRRSGNMPVVAPLRTQAREAVEACLERMGPEKKNFFIVDPLDYLDFSFLAAHARGIITDSGNVAEEATFNQVACITLNSYTEHIETVKVGTNVLVGEDPVRLAEAVTDMVAGQWKDAQIPDRWDGRSAERIVKILLDR
ncbi:MAG: non-hydrolyzing UDP-N-acetylglucosamine 2-epimerase [Prevotella sp.]|jgi:UDP-N-acetylglucosamine 2-epimerase (non-hydrolysing)